MRALLYAAVFVLVAFALLPLLRAWGRSLLSPRRSRHDELVKDPVCQTYIVLSRAVKAEVHGVVTHFCSRECAMRFARGDRRR